MEREGEAECGSNQRRNGPVPPQLTPDGQAVASQRSRIPWSGALISSSTAGTRVRLRSALA